MSSNDHLNPGPIFPCSVCTGNVTWRGKSVQWCVCSKWIYLECSARPTRKSTFFLAITVEAAIPTYCISGSQFTNTELSSPEPSSMDTLHSTLPPSLRQCSSFPHSRLPFFCPTINPCSCLFPTLFHFRFFFYAFCPSAKTLNFFTLLSISPVSLRWQITI